MKEQLNKVLRLVHTKHANCNDNSKDKPIVLQIVLNIKEQQSPHHNYNGTEKQ